MTGGPSGPIQPWTIHTPPVSDLKPPTEGDMRVYETGPDHFPNLNRLGSFRRWDWKTLSTANLEKGFNCFAWSVGFPDRWIDGGTAQEMTDLYKAYHFMTCTEAEADVELYHVPDTPRMLTSVKVGKNPRTFEYENPLFGKIRHAHRRDNPAGDRAPIQGCSSKMGKDTLIAHNRYALQDKRKEPAQKPSIQYGTIYQHWKANPATHPFFPGNEQNVFPIAGHYPCDPIFTYGYGQHPPGHPNDHIGVPGGSTVASGSGTNTYTANTTTAAGTASSSSGGSSHSRNSSDTSETSASTTSKGSKGKAAASLVFKAYSGKAHPTLKNMGAYASIPAPSQAAVTSANTCHSALKNNNKPLAADFEKKWKAWINVWESSSVFKNASESTHTDQFHALKALGAVSIPLVVHKLTDKANFIGTFLYNDLEKDKNFKVHPKDLLNFLVLQRQANLIVEMNSGRM